MELVAVPHYRFGLESLWDTGQWPAVLESGLGKFLGIIYPASRDRGQPDTPAVELLMVPLQIGEDPSICGVETTDLLSCSRDSILLIYA
jgi:hypothetical protein